MALERTLSNPAVEVNDTVIGIVPNSCSFKTGRGNVTVRAQSSGGDAIEMIRTENAETKISMVKFKLFNTQTNVSYMKDWQANKENGNTIRLSDGTFTESFRQMFVTEDPEVMLGADGELEVTFMGKPAL